MRKFPVALLIAIPEPEVAPHFPPIEEPEAFVAAVLEFLGAGAPL